MKQLFLWLIKRVTLKRVLIIALLTPLLSGVSFAQEQGVNERSVYWRSVEQGDAGRTQIKGAEQGVLINASGESWRKQKEGQRDAAKWILPGILIAIALAHIATGGGVKLEQRSGKLVKRFSGFERFVHWATALCFFVLLISGLLLLVGREWLIPLIGGEAFAPLARLSKVSHNYVGSVFLALTVIMFLMWVRHNIPHKRDIKWLLAGGGMIGKKHAPPSDKMNGGEKVWFWIIFFVGILGLGISGVVMDFPNLGAERSDMQLANTIHTICSFIFIAVAFGHIYIGTKGVEGSLEGMKTGYVDENWAKEHHSIWYEKLNAAKKE